MTHTVALRRTEPVTHDTYHLTFDKPSGYAFRSGQACELALDRDGWREARRPFSFVSQPEDETLDFIIKSYPSRGGVTAEVPRLEPGDQVIIGDAFGRIEDRGPGVFIAGGAGITPFVPILRRRARDGDALSACTLIYSNRSEQDVILRSEWEAMEGLGKVFTVTRQQDTALPSRRIDDEFLEEVLKGFREVFYICGPESLTRGVMDALDARGVPEEKIVQDQW